MNRRDFLRNAGLAAMTAGLGSAMIPAAAQGPGQRPPNIVVILADDLGYGDLGCYGNPAVSTPHLDALAREGMRFTDFHSNGPMCSPTRAALLTGRYQNRMGIEFALGLLEDPPVGRGLPTDEVTIAQLLRAQGYRTGLFGKWHLGQHPRENPTRFGFEEFRGLVCGCGDFVSQINRLGLPDWWHNDVLEPEEGNTTGLITDHSVRFIEEHRDEPFFLYVAHLSIHFPWMASDGPAHRELGKDYTGVEDPANSKLGPHVGSDRVQSVVHGMIEDLDRSTGRIIETLRRLRLDENTLVFFVSDNGGYRNYQGLHEGEISDNGPLRGQKAEVFEGGHRVPAIAWWPGHIAPGSESQDTALTMDLAPTLLRLAGGEPVTTPPKPLDGISLLPVLRGEGRLPERTLFWRMRTARAARRGHWKLVRIGDDAPLLYHLGEDIGETRDLSADYPGLTRELLEALEAWEREMDAEAARVPGGPAV